MASNRRLISWLILLFNFNALFFLVAAFQLDALRDFDLPVFFKVAAFTIEQAFLSAVLVLFIGLLAAPGFAALGEARRFIRWILILPNMMSPILAVLCLVLSFKEFPYGFSGILLGHAFLNSGLCTVWLGERWLELESRWNPINKSLGGRLNWFYYRKCILPQMLPQIRNTFAVIFALCLASFAIPLVLGGGPSHSTLEVLIYEKIHASADVTGAVIVGLVQCLIQFLVFALILKSTLLKKEYSRISHTQVRLSSLSLVTCAVTTFSVFPLIRLGTLAFSQPLVPALTSMEGFREAATMSLVIGVSLSFVVFLGLTALTGLGWRDSVLSAPTLSGVAVGLGGILVFKSWSAPSLFSVGLALLWGHLTVLFLPVLRLCAPSLTELRLKFEKVLEQLGASRTLSFRRVYLKLGLKTCLTGACLAGCWSFGEFSVASLVSPSHPTLPIFIQSLMGSYRLEGAAAASLILLGLSALSTLLMEVLAHGLG